MQRQSHEEVAAAARRRLELLGRELEQAGLRRVDEPQEDWDGHDPQQDPQVALTPAAPVRPPGRHLRPAGPRLGPRLVGLIGDRLPESLKGRVGLDLGPVAVVLVLVAAAVAVAGFALLRAGGDAQAVPARSGPTLIQQHVTDGASPPGALPSATLSPATAGSAGPSSAPTAATAAGQGTVTVDVAGRVHRPGVAVLPAGSRVVDALRKAGGARGRVDLSALNLARVLVDGEQILVGRPPGHDASVPGSAAAGASAGAPDPAGSLVNLNPATAEQLDSLPGVGPVTAQKILEWRAAHGAFSSVDELLEVDGIGQKTLADIAPHVTL